MKIFC